MVRPSPKLWLRLLALGACVLGGCVGPGLEPPRANSLAPGTSTIAAPMQGVDAGGAKTAGPSPMGSVGMQAGAPPGQAAAPAPGGITPAPSVPPTMPGAAAGAGGADGTSADADDDAGIPDAAVTPDAAVMPDAAAVTPAP